MPLYAPLCTGVGAGLNVHEGPISISARYGNQAGLRAGMVLSNEPGYYQACKLGAPTREVSQRGLNLAHREG